MSQVFILQNQHQQFLSKQSEWVDGRDTATLYKTPHRDEALNQMFEVNAKDYSQRIKLLPCATNNRGLPIIEADQLPPPDLGQAEPDRAPETTDAAREATQQPDPAADGQCAETRQASLEANCERNETSLAEPFRGTPPHRGI